MPAVQMNTRIDRQLKKDGDRAFAQAGYTPSDAVRLLWAWAASRTHEPQQISSFFEKECMDDSAKAVVSRKRMLAKQGGTLVEKFREENGLVAGEKFVNQPVKTLKEIALLERYEEKGLL